MILYHGSYTQIKNPKILFQEKGRDFGFGFYTTSIKEQAERWAVRVARLYSKQTEKEEIAIVNIYEFDEKLEISEKMKEESRILYVAMTRTIRNLVWFNDLDSCPEYSWADFLEGSDQWQ